MWLKYSLVGCLRAHKMQVTKNIPSKKLKQACIVTGWPDKLPGLDSNKPNRSKTHGSIARIARAFTQLWAKTNQKIKL